MGPDGANVEYLQTAVESIAAADESFDVVVSVYLFHELPETVRAPLWAGVRAQLWAGVLRGAFVLAENTAPVTIHPCIGEAQGCRGVLASSQTGRPHGLQR